MAMIVDLTEMDFRQVIDLINWCIANRIDYDRANDLKFAWYEAPGPEKFRNHDWQLDIPEEHLTYWLLKWK